jgi:small subunit ribosomal protein S16
MAVKIRLKRLGRTHRPFYRVNAVVDRNPRDGRVLEQLGHFDPMDPDDSKQFVCDLDRAKHWMDTGAIPSQTVSSLLKKAGVEHKMLRLPKPGTPKKTEEEAEKK